MTGSKTLEIIEKYCCTAEGYDELYAQEQFEKYDVVFKKNSVDIHGVILDDGAGTCLLLEYLHTNNLVDHVSYYIALDVTRCMLELCARRVEKLLLPHIVEIVEADAAHLPLRDKSVDYSFSFTVFDLLEDPLGGICEQSRVTRKAAYYSLLRRAEYARKASFCIKSVGETDKDVVCLNVLAGACGKHYLNTG